MKKSVLLLTILCIPIAFLWAGTITKTFTYNQNEISINKINEYDVVSLPGCLNTYEEGNPLLPIGIYTVCIPSNATVTNIKIINKQSTELPGEYLIYPVQPGIPLNLTGPITFQVPNPVIYNSAEPYPKNLVSYNPTGNKSGYRLCSFTLYPMQYLPQSKKLILHTSLQVKITYQEGDFIPLSLTKKQINIFGKEIRSFIINPEDLNTFAPPFRTTLQGDLEYVIITSDAFVSNLQPLADWRTQMGLKGEVKTTTWIYSNYTGIDNPEKIRNFIIDQFQHHGLLFVVLAGDVAVVPVRNARISYSGYTYDMPCDWYFADLDGSWNGNHNNLWGERVGDSLDLYADVHVGRAPIDNTTQADAFVNKVFTYEKNPDPNYVKKVLLPCVQLFSGYHGRLVQDSIANITSPGWVDTYLIDPTNTMPMRDSINAGFQFCHVAAHGNVTVMGDQSGNTIYNNSTAQSQTNTNKLGIFNSIACDCGYFDYGSGDCLAEECFNNPNGGFIGVMMNAREGWGSPPNAGPSERLDIRFFDFIFNYDTFELGAAHIRSKEYHRDLILSNALWHFCALELNLLGDPAIVIWTESPQNLTVDFPECLPIGTSTLTVYVLDNGSPVSNALVCAAKANEVYASGKTNSSGSVDLIITPTTPGHLDITVTAHNYYPVEDSALIRSSGAYVSHLRHSIDDVAGGNGDGIVNPGETIEMPTWVKNWGNEPANNVSSVLRTSCLNVTLTDTVKNYGTIAAGDSTFTGSNGYNYTVAPSCTNGYLIPLQLVCQDENDSIWQSNVNILVGTCVLTYADKIVYDPAPGGNNNGKIDPGETGDLVVVLRNAGFGNGYNVSALLRSGDSRLTILDSIGNFGTVYHDTTGNNQSNEFTVMADNNIPQETPIPCTLYINADGGYSVMLSFDLVIGEIRTFDPIPDGPRNPPLFWAYDNTDAFYTNCPTYDWVEIDSIGTQLYYNQNDDVLSVPLPSEFGPIYFYGNRYTDLSVSADGFVVFGNDLTRRYTNYPIPGSQAPAAFIAINWDDLYPNYQSAGYVYHYHDVANHRFIIEYDSVAYYNPRSVKDKFELIIYDTTVVTPNGDNILLSQYMTANRYTSSTIGIQDPTRTIGIQYVYDGVYHHGAAPMTENRAIKYITGEPITAIYESDSKNEISIKAFQLEPCLPNPFQSKANFRYNLTKLCQTSLRIYNATGRLVTTLVNENQNPGSYSITWNGKDKNGKQVAGGVYFFTLSSGKETLTRKMLKIQ